jgi:hypothetical protein
MLMTKMSVIECFFVRSIRGSLSVANFSISVEVTVVAFFITTVDHTTQPIAIIQSLGHLDAIALHRGCTTRLRFCPEYKGIDKGIDVVIYAKKCRDDASRESRFRAHPPRTMEHRWVI